MGVATIVAHAQRRQNARCQGSRAKLKVEDAAKAATILGLAAMQRCCGVAAGGGAQMVFWRLGGVNYS